MSEMYGIVSSGFNPKPYNIILGEKKAKAQDLFGLNVDLSETSPLLLMLEVQALEEAELWEMCEAFYYSGYVDYASGISLDRIAAIIGETRKAATQSTVTVRFTGTPATNIPASTIIQTAGTEPIQFTTNVLAVIPGGGYVDVACTAVLYGVSGNVGALTITVQQNPISGVSGINNTYAAVGGTDVESDGSFRLRIKEQVTEISKGTLDAIRQAILNLDGVISVKVTEDLDTHLVSAYVDGRTQPDTEVNDAIEGVRPAGIPVYWYGVTSQTIYVRVDVSVNDGAPIDVVTQIKDAIISYIGSLAAGDDVIYMKVVDSIYDIEGVDDWIEDITTVKIDIVSPPTITNTNLAVGIGMKANLTMGNTTVNITIV